MRVAVLSDIHGNLPALDAVLAATRGAVDGYVCLGDLVNYGPWGDECVDRVLGLANLTIVRGNHEDLFLAPHLVAGEIPLVRRFFEAAYPRFSRQAEIASLPTVARAGPFRCVHTVDGRRVYADTPVDIAEDTCIGHSHHQYLVERGGHRLLNPGSVGQNRARVDLACFALLDTVSGDVSLGSVTYDVAALLGAMERGGWPRECVDYYRGKLPREAPGGTVTPGG